jgi:molybdate transport system regulatory protein
MKISARNVLPGTIRSVTHGAVNAEITLTLEGCETIVAIITNTSADALGLQQGLPAFAVIKASEVILGTDLAGAKLSARNILAGTVTAIHDGAVNSEVELQLPGGTTLAASITKASVAALELHVGDAVSAIVKASNVLIAV